VLSDPTTHFVRRLRDRDPAAWFELWENFGPVLRAQLARWGRGRIGPETVQDLSQETMTALTDAIHRHDPSRGARFSTWLLAIAKHALAGEMDRRNAQKRGSGRRGVSLDEAWTGASPEPGPDTRYEQEVFDAKVAAALRGAERECGFADFSVYRQRVFEQRSGREVAEALALSEATVSRRLTAVRERIRQRLGEVFVKYSFSEEERDELLRKGLDPNPTKAADATFDAVLAEVYHRFSMQSSSPDPLAATDSPAARQPRSTGLGGLSRVVRSFFPRRGDPEEANR
jgi:RNA polymerase sigma factor (sigma-70 family)